MSDDDIRNSLSDGKTRYHEPIVLPGFQPWQNSALWKSANKRPEWLRRAILRLSSQFQQLPEADADRTLLTGEPFPSTL
jgi:hypothetical protein